MFERYSEAARRALFFARYEASQLGDVNIEPEHLLLAILREPASARGMLADMAKETDAVRAVIQRHLNGKPNARVEIPFSSACKAVLASAVEEADRMLHQTIGPEHLLLGILRVESSLAASLLRQHNVTLEDARRKMPHLVGQAGDLHLHLPNILESHRSGRVRIWPSPSDDSSMDEGGQGHWLLEGFSLKAALARASEIPEPRIHLPTTLDNGRRYDFLLTGHMPGERDGRGTLMLKGIEKHFNVTTERESRPIDVYVMTAPGGIRAQRSKDEGVGGEFVGVGSIGIEYTVQGNDPDGEPSTIGPLSGSPFPLDIFCQILGEFLHRPVVNETRVAGTFDLALPVSSRGIQGFLYSLEERFGLVVTPGVRNLDVLVVRER